MSEFQDQVTKLVEQLQPRFGQEIAVGNWLTIDQPRIDRFAEVTGDQQWIHVDPERAAKDSPYGRTVAHGFLTLALLPFLTASNSLEYLAEHFPGMRLRVNYGLNRIRYPQPVLAGDRIRARTVLVKARPVADGVEVVYNFTVEIDGQKKPGLVAEQLVRVYP
jgi:acyl dehydratase